MKQEWSKTQARLKQDSSKSQARVKQESSKSQARQQAGEEKRWKTMTFFINLAQKERLLKRILVWKRKKQKKAQKPLWFMWKIVKQGHF